jgi:hypothetical protein
MYAIKALLYQACMSSVFAQLCSCGFGHQTAKDIIIHCHYFSAAQHAFTGDQGHLPDYKQRVTSPTGLKKVTRWVIESGMLGQYQRARGLLYPPGPFSIAND